MPPRFQFNIPIVQSPVKSLREWLTKQHCRKSRYRLRSRRLYNINRESTAMPSEPKTQRREMSEVLKGMIIAFFWCFHNYSFVARLVKRSESTVRTFLKRASERGHIQNLPRSGRPSKLTRRDKSCIKRAWRRDRFQSKEEVCAILNILVECNC